MSELKPYFKCPMVLQHGMHGTYYLIVTRRDGTRKTLKYYPRVLAKKALAEQMADNDTVTITFGGAWNLAPGE